MIFKIFLPFFQGRGRGPPWVFIAVCGLSPVVAQVLNCLVAQEILVAQPGIKPSSSTLEGRFLTLDYWEVPKIAFRFMFYLLHCPFCLLAFVFLLVQLHYRNGFFILFQVLCKIFLNHLIHEFFHFGFIVPASAICLLAFSSLWNPASQFSPAFCGHVFPCASQVMGNLLFSSFTLLDCILFPWLICK